MVIVIKNFGEKDVFCRDCRPWQPRGGREGPKMRFSGQKPRLKPRPLSKKTPMSRQQIRKSTSNKKSVSIFHPKSFPFLIVRILQKFAKAIWKNRKIREKYLMRFAPYNRFPLLFS
jgi:hypothetical protein